MKRKSIKGAYPRNWIVCVQFESQSGETLVTCSKPLFWKRAKSKRNEYRALGHKSWCDKVTTVELLSDVK